MGAPPLLPPPVEITLSLFGGMDTEISPSDVPEGLSPDNQDMVYTPGNTQTRPCLHKLFNPSLGAVTVLYQKTYVQPNGRPLTLVLTSDGKLWVEDITNTPGTASQIGTTPSGLYAQSVTAFGREYIAVSDLLHGAGVPLQYDGTHLDRVTQDGPGAPPTLTNYLPPAVTLQGSGAGAPVNGSNAVVSDPYTVDPPDGGGGGGLPCFSGNTRVVLLDGVVRFDAAPARAQVRTSAGFRWARRLVHDYTGPMQVMPNDELSTPEHPFRVGEDWQAARTVFPESVAFSGKVYNWMIETDVDEERNYDLANGWNVHNKIDPNDGMFIL